MKRILMAAAFVLAACEAGDAQPNADKWAKAMGIEGPIVCVQQDSDGDGYVSCTYKEKGEMHAVECSTGRGIGNNGGCRLPKVKAVKGSD